VKLQLAQFRELAAFSQFESDLDAATKAQLDRGARIVEMFKQGVYSPVPVSVQTGVMWAMENNFFDTIDVSRITAAVESLKEYFSGSGKKVVQKIHEEGNLTEGIEEDLRRAVEDWKRSFA